jgi:hypothetical protein
MFLLDAWHAFGERRYFESAVNTYFDLARDFRMDPGAYATRRFGAISHGLLTGIAGVGALLLRLTGGLPQRNMLFPTCETLTQSPSRATA